MKIFAFAVLVTIALPWCAVADTPSLEAASIRPSTPGTSPIPVDALPDAFRFHGGPGTSDPSRIRYTQVTLQQLLARAYGLDLKQVSGPGWIENDRYDITATLPAGTDQENLLLMLQGLLSERFKVRMRHESKTVAVYDLTVMPGGPKLKPPEIVPTIDNSEDAGKKSERDARAGLQADLERMRNGGPSDTFHIERGTTKELIRDLLRHVDRPIVDQTKLTGTFSFDLQWTPASMNASAGMNSNPDIFAALEQQMGLKLSPRNEVLETIVVESAERSPEN